MQPGSALRGLHWPLLHPPGSLPITVQQLRADLMWVLVALLFLGESTRGQETGVCTCVHVCVCWEDTPSPTPDTSLSWRDEELSRSWGN